MTLLELALISGLLGAVFFLFQWQREFRKETRCRGQCWDLGSDADSLKSYKECIKQCMSS